jgi:flagellar biosynthesis chaperone FliJ
MQKFQFSLERVRSWRRTELQAEEARLAPLVAERQRLEAAQREIALARRQADRDLLEANSVQGCELEALARFRVRLENQKSAVEGELAAWRDRMARQSARILEAHRRLRLLDKLRERRLGEWRAGWDREIETLASEAFLARWRTPHRRPAGGSASLPNPRLNAADE